VLWRSNRKTDLRVVAWRSTADLRAVGSRSNRKPDLRVVAKNEKQEEKEVPTPQEVFEGINGRPPNSDQELNEWLASPEGKAAMVYKLTFLSRWGDAGRS
jgi:hypothetical protein